MTRITLVVEVNTDPLPGWGHDPVDYEALLARYLYETIPHYDPKVRLLDLEVARRANALLRAHGTADGCVAIQGRLIPEAGLIQ